MNDSDTIFDPLGQSDILVGHILNELGFCYFGLEAGERTSFRLPRLIIRSPLPIEGENYWGKFLSHYQNTLCNVGG
jgi:hypothetical protein